jgi:hypothetical protein
MKSRAAVLGLGIPTWVLSIFEWMTGCLLLCCARSPAPVRTRLGDLVAQASRDVMKQMS